MAPIANVVRRALVEALGTFTLVALGPGAVMVAARTHAFGHAGVSAAFGLAIVLIVASAGHLSGAHVNPAVTIGFWSVGRFRGRDVPAYVVAQCIGASAPSLLPGWLVGPVGDFGVTVPGLPIAQSFVVEAGYSGLLAFVIMAVATDPRSPVGVAPFAIGLTVGAGALVTGPLTGGSFNPARSLGPAIASGIWTAHWLYWSAPMIGMLAAMRLHETIRYRTKRGVVEDRLGTEGTI